jgi:hypothetical protein
MVLTPSKNVNVPVYVLPKLAVAVIPPALASGSRLFMVIVIVA